MWIIPLISCEQVKIYSLFRKSLLTENYWYAKLQDVDVSGRPAFLHGIMRDITQIFV